MKTCAFTLAVALAVLAMSGAAAFGQESENYKKHPGYVDLEFVKALGEPKTEVEIFLTPGLARLLGGLDEDEELESVLRKLALIKVYAFDVRSKDREWVLDKIHEMSKKLQSNKWERFINIKEEGGKTQIFIRETDKEIQGMTILSLDNQEATFVNLVGIIDLDSIGKLSRKYDIPHLDSLQQQQKKNK